MRKKKQEMLQTQIECQKVTLPVTLFLHLYPFTFSYQLYLCLLGFNKSLGEEPRHET